MGNSISNRQDIENLINTRVELVNKQVFNIMNKVTQNVTSNIVNNQVATKKSTGAASNLLVIKRTTIKNGGIADFNQLADYKSWADALITVSSDTNKLADMSAQIASEITSELSQNIDLQNDLKAANAIEKEKKIDGEINNIVDKIGGALSDLTKIGANQDNDITIKNTIMQTISQSNYYESNFKDVVNNYVTSNISNTLLNNCIDSSSSFNQVDISDLVIDGGTLQSNQQALLQNFSSCLISNMAVNTDIQKMATDMKNKASQETTTDVKEKNTMDVTNSIKNLETQTSIISEMLNTIIYVVAAIAIIGFIILVGVPGTEALKKPIVGFFNTIKKTPVGKVAKVAVETAKVAVETA
jgi:hypothetical protein